MSKWTEPAPTANLATVYLECYPMRVSFIVEEYGDDGHTEWLLDRVRIGGAWVSAVDAFTTDFHMAVQSALRKAEREFYGADAVREPEPEETHARHSVINERGLVVVAWWVYTANATRGGR